MKTKLPLYLLYADTEPVGVIPLCNYGGVEVLEIKEDSVIACFNFGTGRSSIRHHKIEYRNPDCSGRPFFRKNGNRYYFDEIIRR